MGGVPSSYHVRSLFFVFFPEELFSYSVSKRVPSKKRAPKNEGGPRMVVVVLLSFGRFSRETEKQPP